MKKDHDDAHVVEMSRTTMDNLELFDGDVVRLKGKMNLIHLALVAGVEGIDDGVICMNSVTRRNLRVRLGDMITCKAQADTPHLSRVSLAPLADTVDGLTGDLKATFLDGYFSTDTSRGGLDSPRPVQLGSLLRINGAMRQAWFKVTEVEAADGKSEGGLVVVRAGPAGPGAAAPAAPATMVICEEPISREEGEEGLNAIGYSDVGGLSEQLENIREIIELPIRHPKLFAAIGVKPPKGVLMHGPPGCGKTLIARAIANETGCFFFVINGPEIMSGVQGKSEENLRQAFAEVAKNAPGVLFIDEIDAIAPNRDKNQDEHMRRIVATLLTEMDGIKGSAHVMVIAATNRPNALDPALRRAGRFDTEVAIPVPSQKGRREILDILTKQKGMKLQEEGEQAVDLDKIAEMTHGYVGADLTAMCTKAAVAYVRKQAQGILDMTADDLPAGFLDGLRVEMSEFETAIRNTTASALRDVTVEIPNVKFDDIGGLEAVKQELREMVEMPVKYPELFEEAGILPPKGALMFGPPGCGKTMLAKAVANECEANFISVKGPQLLSKWFGESEENVREIFDKARRASPCIIFFDELDSIAMRRGGHTGGGPGDRVVNQLLTEMDGIGERKNVFILGATNNVTGMDKAVLRTGRLDQLIYIPMPDRPAIEAILRACLRKAPVSRRVNLELLADDCFKKGLTGADVNNCCQMAVKISLRERLVAEAEGKSTDDWELQPHCLELAFMSTQASLSGEMLGNFKAQAAEIMEEMGMSAGGQVTAEEEAAAAARSTGKYRLAPGHADLEGPPKYGAEAWELEKVERGLDSDGEEYEGGGDRRVAAGAGAGAGASASAAAGGGASASAGGTAEAGPA